MFIFVHFVHSSVIYSKRAQISSEHFWSCWGMVKNALSPTTQNVHFVHSSVIYSTCAQTSYTS